MHPFGFAAEISHLERIVRELSVAGPIRELPLCYWRVRVSRIPPDRLVPAERARLARVQETLDRLESMQRDQNAA